MQQVELKYGEGTITVQIPTENMMGILLPNPIQVERTDEEAVKYSLEHPIGSPRLSEMVKEDSRVVIVTSDITRPMPSATVLPYVMEELKRGGVRQENVTVVLALGSHRKHSDQEKEKLVGSEVYHSGATILDSDMDQCLRLGTCRNGTPVDIFTPVVDADIRVCLGNVEFHYFAGYSGGNKALMPGVSSHDAIQANHSNMVHPDAYAGNIDTNPVRQDIEEITDFIPIEFIVNVVLDDHKKIVGAFSGHHVEAHREACRLLDRIYKIPLEEKADIVIASPGGFPKDINIYQSQKGLDNAKHAVKKGGIIIWPASAKEGFGEKVFEEWMRNKTPAEMVEEIQRNFKLGGHKAAAISMILQDADIFMVSDLPDDLVRQIHFIPFASLQEALDEALRKMGKDAKVLVLPAAGSTLPML